jgi:hypothetical protein
VGWSRGRLGEAVSGYRRFLAAEGAHLVVAMAMAGVAAAALSACAYAVVLLLPVQSWVLGAADSYSHFATLPVGLWTLAALIELAQRSLPTAVRARPESRAIHDQANPHREEAARHGALPHVGASTP